MFNHDQFHDPEFRNLVRAARAVIAERVGRGIATDEDDDAAVEGLAPSAAFRDAVRAHRRSRRWRSTSASSRRSPTKSTEIDGGGETMH